MVKNLPSDAGDVGSIPGRGTRSYRPRGNEVHVLQPERPKGRSEELAVQLRPNTGKLENLFF